MESLVLNEVELLEGKPFPLGATPYPDGVNFALFSENAHRVDLVLFDDPDDKSPSRTVTLHDKTGPVWHGFVSGLKPGQLYGFRVHGPYHPEEAHRFNPNKVVLDPYAKSIGRSVQWHDSLFGYIVGDKDEDLSFSNEDNAPYAPLGVVIDSQFDWSDETRPNVHWRDTIIYETHVKGLSNRHPDVPKKLRGTYLGVCSEPIIEHLRSLGVTAIQLLPVHAFLQDRHLVERGLSNYWGYNTLNFFSPEPTYSSGGPFEAVNEFKEMVRVLHNEGFEVFLDVVYNHTAEGNRLGPTLSFKGIDSRSYYKESPESLRYYMDFTGTGNTLDLGNPHVLQLVTDSLRYWASEMHVDGFRFDLASVLARQLFEINMLSPFFQVIQQDPVLSQVKLIAEPWDVGMGGYQVGGFPWQWAEWNGRYRDSIRSFWTGDPDTPGELATRIAGSSDLYAHSGRRPFASVNFVTAHDGFTLEDLVSYNHKHNEANGENNRDGHDDNRSTNCGHEGKTDDPDVLRCREQLKRNLMASLLLSQGVPMILGGDELSKTQDGNNNAYCQDNELNWYDWDLDERKTEFLTFVRNLIAFRKEHPAFRRRHFLKGVPVGTSGLKDVSWWHPEGHEMTEDEWGNNDLRVLGMLLSSDSVDARDPHGHLLPEKTFLVTLNTGGPAQFILPGYEGLRHWELMLSTVHGQTLNTSHEPGKKMKLKSSCVLVFAAVEEPRKDR